MESDTFAEMLEKSNHHNKMSEEAAYSEISDKYDITHFEISLVEHEGKLKSWDIGKAALPEEPVSSRVAFRDKLRCTTCNTPESAAYWPKSGDQTPFYYQSAEETKTTPGAYALPIKCPNCSTIWYVVWDDDPMDPIGGHFLKHLVRAFDFFPSNVEILYSFISDKVLRKVVSLLEKPVSIQYTGDNQKTSIHSDTFLSGDTYHLITMIPTGNLDNAKNFFPGGYMQSLTENSSESAPPNLYSEIRLVNWIFCFSRAEEIANVQLTFVPSNKDPHELETIVPSEFMTEHDMNELLMLQCKRLPDVITMRYIFSEQKALQAKELLINMFHKFGANAFEYASDTEFGQFFMSAEDNVGEMIKIRCARLEDLSYEYTVRLLRPSDTHSRMLMQFSKITLHQIAK